MDRVTVHDDFYGRLVAGATVGKSSTLKNVTVHDDFYGRLVEDIMENADYVYTF